MSREGVPTKNFTDMSQRAAPIDNPAIRFHVIGSVFLIYFVRCINLGGIDLYISYITSFFF